MLATLLSDAYWRSTETRLFRRAGKVPSAEEQEMVREVEESHLFDPAWYLRHNLDSVREQLQPGPPLRPHGRGSGAGP